MRKTMFVASAAILAALFSLPSALQAHDGSKQRDESGQTMGSGMMGQMGHMMGHCGQMMHGASTRPNEQWRDSTPPDNDQSRKSQ